MANGSVLIIRGWGRIKVKVFLDRGLNKNAYTQCVVKLSVYLSLSVEM